MQDAGLHRGRGQDLVGQVNGNDSCFGCHYGVAEYGLGSLWVTLYSSLGLYQLGQVVQHSIRRR